MAGMTMPYSPTRGPANDPFRRPGAPPPATRPAPQGLYASPVQQRGSQPLQAQPPRSRSGPSRHDPGSPGTQPAQSSVPESQDAGGIHPRALSSGGVSRALISHRAGSANRVNGLLSDGVNTAAASNAGQLQRRSVGGNPLCRRPQNPDAAHAEQQRGGASSSNTAGSSATGNGDPGLRGAMSSSLTDRGAMSSSGTTFANCTSSGGVPMSSGGYPSREITRENISGAIRAGSLPGASISGVPGGAGGGPCRGLGVGFGAGSDEVRRQALSPTRVPAQSPTRAMIVEHEERIVWLGNEHEMLAYGMDDFFKKILNISEEEALRRCGSPEARDSCLLFGEPQYHARYLQRLDARRRGADYARQLEAPEFHPSRSEHSPKALAHFLCRIMRHGKFQPAEAICAFLYLQRYLGEAGFPLHTGNWRPLLVTALLISAKYVEDKPVKNASMVEIYPVLVVTELNVLEECMLMLMWGLGRPSSLTYISAKHFNEFIVQIRTILISDEGKKDVIQIKEVVDQHGAEETEAHERQCQRQAEAARQGARVDMSRGRSPDATRLSPVSAVAVPPADRSARGVERSRGMNVTPVNQGSRAVSTPLGNGIGGGGGAEGRGGGGGHMGTSGHGHSVEGQVATSVPPRAANHLQNNPRNNTRKTVGDPRHVSTSGMPSRLGGGKPAGGPLHSSVSAGEVRNVDARVDTGMCNVRSGLPRDTFSNTHTGVTSTGSSRSEAPANDGNTISAAMTPSRTPPSTAAPSPRLTHAYNSNEAANRVNKQASSGQFLAGNRQMNVTDAFPLRSGADNRIASRCLLSAAAPPPRTNDGSSGAMQSSARIQTGGLGLQSARQPPTSTDPSGSMSRINSPANGSLNIQRGMGQAPIRAMDQSTVMGAQYNRQRSTSPSFIQAAGPVGGQQGQMPARGRIGLMANPMVSMR